MPPALSRDRRVPRGRRRARRGQGRPRAAPPPSAPPPAPSSTRRPAHDPPLALDYLALVDPADFTEIPDDFTGEAVLAVAARVGTTRLIDNIPLTFGAAS